MGKEAIKYLRDKGISDAIVFQSKKRRVWLSDLMDVYAKHTNAQQVKSVDLSQVVERSEQLVCHSCNKRYRLTGGGAIHEICTCHLDAN